MESIHTDPTTAISSAQDYDDEDSTLRLSVAGEILHDLLALDSL